MGSDKAFCQKKIESIKCEVAKLDLLEQVLNFKSGKECLHSLLWKHCQSMSHTRKTSLTSLLSTPLVGAINTEVAPPLLHFSHEQQQQLQSSMKDI